MDRNERFLVGVYALLLMAYLVAACSPVGYQPGRVGDTGPAGPPVSIITAPATSQQCPTGGVQVTVGGTLNVICNGLTGAQGQNGQNGQNGANGANGADGTQVTIVQLCPGVNSYPGVFVEVALLINGKLYAVYSANNGFLTYLPPGAYQSNAIGSACNFTVNADNTVSH